MRAANDEQCCGGMEMPRTSSADRPPLTDERHQSHAADRSGTNPDDRHRNRDTQTKRTENRQNELGKQTHVVSYAR
jgi:hypothetical protein